MKRLAIEYWTPLVLWLAVMFFFSTDRFAADNTSRIIIPLLNLFFPSLSPPGLEFWHGFIRKLGHIAGYFILAVLTYRSVKEERPDLIQAKLRSFSFVICAATLDEIHQRFTLFRTASPIDVGYDCLGAVWALWLMSTYETRSLRTHSIL